MRRQRTRSRALCGGLALASALLLGPLARAALAEEPHGVEVLPAKVAASAQTPEAPDVEASGDQALPPSPPVVLVLSAPGTRFVLDPPFPPPSVTARGWEPDRPPQMRVHSIDDDGSARIPVRGWNPDRPSRLRVHSWSGGTP